MPSRAWGCRRRVLLVAIVLLGTTALSLASEREPIPPFLSAYLQDPDAHRDQVLRLAKDDVATLPTPVLLALADASLRARDVATAARVLGVVSARDGTAAWGTWAELGLGWIAVTAGDADGARIHFARVAAAPSHAAAGRLMLAVLDAGAGRRGSAGVLEGLAGEPATPVALRPLSALAAAYALLWTGRHGRALEAFEHAATVASGTGLADDAQYGAAVARWRAGNRAAAIDELQALAEAPRRGGRAALSRSLVRLEAGAVLGAGARTYTGPAMEPEARLASLFDLDAPTLARAALRQLHHGPPVARGPTMVGTVTREGAAALPSTAPGSATSAAGGRPPAQPRDPAPRAVGLTLLLVLAVGVVVLVSRRPRRAARQHAAERR
jgi:hypothetical protein